jgi:cytochrome c peroxidase
MLRDGADSLDASLVALSATLRASATWPAARRDSVVFAAFADSRVAYKHIEGFVELYAPAVAASLNSRRQEVDDDDAPPPSTLGTAGFPAIEPVLGRGAPRSAAERRLVIALVDSMRGAVRRIRSMAGDLVGTEAQVLEIARQEVTRVFTLGIAGFDAPGSGAGLRESAAALDGVRGMLATVGAERWPALVAERGAVDSALARASSALRADNDFEHADRLRFLVRYGGPAARSLEVLRRATTVAPVDFQRGWRADVGFVYDDGAFDAHVYAPRDAPLPTAALVSLGERLFNEPALSADGSRSCASCHVPSHAFTDGLPRALKRDGHGTIPRHTPTLINAALSPAQFMDERAPTLEEQALRVIETPDEMGASLAEATVRVASRAGYVDAFRAAYGADSGVTAQRLRYALAAYVRSLIALNSRFDRAVRGDTLLLSAEERRGFTVFMGKGQCGTCHFAPLFNGNTPPLYRNADVEVIGTPVSPSRLSVPDADLGRGGVDHLPLHARAFKTPTVRNATLTGPYMHHGAFPTLESVIDFYNRGGGVGAGARLPNQTMSASPLHLTKDDQRALIAFMGALVDTSVAKSATSSSPSRSTAPVRLLRR